MIYTSKPQQIEAVQWTGDNWDEVKAFAGERVSGSVHVFTNEKLVVLRAGKDGAQGWVPVPVGHWIVRNLDGDDSDYWPVDDAYFKAKYEPGDASEAAIMQLLEERDAAYELLDCFASAVSRLTRVEIGEHSNANNPWAIALEAIEGYEPGDTAQPKLRKLEGWYQERATWTGADRADTELVLREGHDPHRLPPGKHKWTDNTYVTITHHDIYIDDTPRGANDGE